MVVPRRPALCRKHHRDKGNKVNKVRHFGRTPVLRAKRPSLSDRDLLLAFLVASLTPYPHRRPELANQASSAQEYTAGEYSTILSSSRDNHERRKKMWKPQLVRSARSQGTAREVTLEGLRNTTTLTRSTQTDFLPLRQLTSTSLRTTEVLTTRLYAQKFSTESAIGPIKPISMQSRHVYLVASLPDVQPIIDYASPAFIQGTISTLSSLDGFSNGVIPQNRLVWASKLDPEY